MDESFYFIAMDLSLSHTKTRPVGLVFFTYARLFCAIG